MTPDSSLKEYFTQQKLLPVRAKSLIVTIMGDLINPLGGIVWGGDLVNICKWFNITTHSSRISIQRLNTEGWIEKVMVPETKRTYYRFTREGEKIFHSSQSLIYGQARDDWGEQWQLLMIHGEENEKIKPLLAELSWLGFGCLNKNTYLLPGDIDEKILQETLKRHGIHKQTIMFQGKASFFTESFRKKTIDEIWPSEYLIPLYKRLSQTLETLVHHNRSEFLYQKPINAVYSRLCLIHAYRGLILKTPQLPLTLQNQKLPKKQLTEMFGPFYHRLSAAGNSYLVNTLKIPNKESYKPDDFLKRFQKQAYFTPRQIISEQNGSSLKMYF